MRIVSTFGAVMLLAACSDSGGNTPAPTPTPTPVPTNTAPTFTSGTAISVQENVTGSIYQAVATDKESNPITFSISGGADAAQFSITAAGALSFTVSPNFELPADAGSNNVYNVQLKAADSGGASTTLDLAVTVLNTNEGILVRRVATGLTQPLFVAPIPGDNNRVFVVGKTGTVYYLTPSDGTVTTAFTVGDLSTDNERGLLGLAARPDFQTSHVVYVHATGTDGSLQIREYVIGNPAYQVRLSTPHPGQNNHNGGWIAFGPDGYLYDATGDGGGTGDPNNNAQNPSSRLGKILRIQVSATGDTFAPAPGNPFLTSGGDPYVFAYGLRNPFRNSFDGNNLYIGDVGQDTTEEIDFLGISQTGLNFGWPFLEGTQSYKGTAPGGLTAPVSQYMHGTGAQQGDSIIGGYVYRGGITSLQGQYVFGDYVSGNIWTVPASSLVAGAQYPSAKYERRNADFTPDSGTIDQLVSFGVDSANNLYLVDIDGDIFFVDPDPRRPL